MLRRNCWPFVLSWMADVVLRIDIGVAKRLRLCNRKPRLYRVRSFIRISDFFLSFAQKVKDIWVLSLCGAQARSATLYISDSAVPRVYQPQPICHRLQQHNSYCGPTPPPPLTAGLLLCGQWGEGQRRPHRVVSLFGQGRVIQRYREVVFPADLLYEVGRFGQRIVTLSPLKDVTVQNGTLQRG